MATAQITRGIYEHMASAHWNTWPLSISELRIRGNYLSCKKYEHLLTRMLDQFRVLHGLRLGNCVHMPSKRNDVAAIPRVTASRQFHFGGKVSTPRPEERSPHPLRSKAPLPPMQREIVAGATFSDSTNAMNGKSHAKLDYPHDSSLLLG